MAAGVTAKRLVGDDDAPPRDQGYKGLAGVLRPGPADILDLGLGVGAHAGLGERGFVEDGGRRIAATGWLERRGPRRQSLEFELQRQVIVVVQHGRGFDEPRRAAQRLELRESGDHDGPLLAVA